MAKCKFCEKYDFKNPHEGVARECPECGQAMDVAYDLRGTEGWMCKNAECDNGNCFTYNDEKEFDYDR